MKVKLMTYESEPMAYESSTMTYERWLMKIHFHHDDESKAHDYETESVSL